MASGETVNIAHVDYDIKAREKAYYRDGHSWRKIIVGSTTFSEDRPSTCASSTEFNGDQAGRVRLGTYTV